MLVLTDRVRCRRGWQTAEQAVCSFQCKTWWQLKVALCEMIMRLLVLRISWQFEKLADLSILSPWTSMVLYIPCFLQNPSVPGLAPCHMGHAGHLAAIFMHSQQDWLLVLSPVDLIWTFLGHSSASFNTAAQEPVHFWTGAGDQLLGWFDVLRCWQI